MFVTCTIGFTKMWLNHYFMPDRYAHTRVVVKYSYTFTLRTTSRSLFKS